MNGPRQSDRPVVPTKSPNNAGTSAGEEMEGRGLAKGNPDQQNALRTLEANLADLSERLKRRAYRAKPVKRTYIPKADGRQRPLGIPTLESRRRFAVAARPELTAVAGEQEVALVRRCRLTNRL